MPDLWNFIFLPISTLCSVSSLNGDDFIPHGAAKLTDIDSSVAAAASESHFLEASNAVKVR